jgi:hypothetical protein
VLSRGALTDGAKLLGGVTHDLFRLKPQIPGLNEARMTNNHIEQDDARFFAYYAIRLAHRQLITMAANEPHGTLLKQASCRKSSKPIERQYRVITR